MLYQLMLMACLLTPAGDCDASRTVVFREVVPFSDKPSCLAAGSRMALELRSQAVAAKLPNGRIAFHCFPTDQGDPA